MTNFERTEFWRELNATDESFVREKYATGGYRSCQRLVVAEWIAERDRLYDRRQGDIQLRTSKRLVFWAIVSACGALAAPIVAILVSMGT